MLRLIYNRINRFPTNTRSYKNIAGRLALVVGASHGHELGREICIQLAKNGCNIAIADLDCSCVVEKLVPTDGKTILNLYKVNVANYSDVQTLREKIERDIGPVDILINNAGVLSSKSTLNESTHLEIARDLHYNLTSQFWTLKTFLPGMKERKHGHVVAICSLAGLAPIPINLTYNATKYGLNGLMDGLRLELKMEQMSYIKTTICYPGFVKTNKGYLKLLSHNDYLRTFPSVKVDKLAIQVVKAILREKHSVFIPKWGPSYLKLSKLLPKRFGRIFGP